METKNKRANESNVREKVTFSKEQKEEVFQQYFGKWIHRMRKCIDIGGDYADKC